MIEEDDDEDRESNLGDDEDGDDGIAAAAAFDDDGLAIVNESNIVLLLNMNLKVVLCDCGRAYKIDDDDEVLSQLSEETGTVFITDKDEDEEEESAEVRNLDKF